MDNKSTIVRTPLFPAYSEVRTLIKIWEGVPKSEVIGMISTISDQTGTPQNPVDWSEPDIWIDKRLAGASRELAQRVWSGSAETVNPRHVKGAYLFINSYGLLKTDSAGVYQFTETGAGFLSSDPKVVRKLDEAEGLPQLLAIVSAHSPAKRGDLLDDWGEFLSRHSKFGTSSTIRDTLRRRILNLVERGYLTREGNTYTITDRGIQYASVTDADSDSAPLHTVQKAIKDYNEAQIAAFRDRLGSMDPYRFESLIKDLLEAMDYEDVTVTKQSGDKGVDVVGSYQFGITQIREVVQVKRQKGSVTRPVLDQLRGALPYHEAIRGTIVTLGRFAQGCKDAALYPGAAPITLIDGDKLIELLLKHGIGVKKRQQALVEIDDSYFIQDD